MKLYHYTSIDSLALILKNRTIRFTRLDMLDDLEENLKSSGVNVGNYSFASCWTEDEEESIPQWKMYTDNGLGVRIALKKDMFKDYHNPEFVELSGIRISTKDFLSITKTPLEDFINPKILVLPITPKEMNSVMFKRVEYVDNVFERTRDCVKIVPVTSNYSRVDIEHPLVGKYKNKRWAFQKEVRFVLLIFPGTIFREKEAAFPQELGQWLYDVWTKNIPNEITYYDMQLKEDIFDTMEITLSPSMPYSKQIIVESLVNIFAPQATVSLSRLSPSVRLK